MGDGGRVTFDESAWPVVVLNSPPIFSSESSADIIAGFDHILSRKDPFALVVDTRPVKAMPNAAWRKKITEWANAPHTQRRTSRYSVGTSLVITSPLARGIYTALSWFVKHTSPQHFAPSMAASVAWCCEQLSRAGVPRSRALVELQASLLRQEEPSGG
jgi:hypothetical protein